MPTFVDAIVTDTAPPVVIVLPPVSTALPVPMRGGFLVNSTSLRGGTATTSTRPGGRLTVGST